MLSLKSRQPLSFVFMNKVIVERLSPKIDRFLAADDVFYLAFWRTFSLQYDPNAIHWHLTILTGLCSPAGILDAS